jgi:hypothetical protein
MGAERDALGILTADAMTEIKAGHREHASLLIAEAADVWRPQRSRGAKANPETFAGEGPGQRLLIFEMRGVERADQRIEEGGIGSVYRGRDALEGRCTEINQMSEYVII